MFRKVLFFVLVLLTSLSLGIYAQGELDSPGQIDGRILEYNYLDYGVPFLTIAPDSRAGAMGDVGAATTPDVNSMHWNPAKYAMIKEVSGVSISYTPWLRKLVDDINLFYLSGFYRIDQQQVIAASLLYFSLGEIIFTGNNAEYISQHTPNEFAIDASYSRYLSNNLSMAMAFRFIRSDLFGVAGGDDTKAGISGAGDVAIYYQKDVTIDDKPSQIAFGANISNIGTKISYSLDNQADLFIPINLKIGGRITMELDEYNKVSFATDINKLLVPTNPMYSDEKGPDGKNIIIKGYNPDVAVPVGMFRSFYDAPGGFREEMQEIMLSFGAEYWYSDQFAIRAGYSYEHQHKGGRKFLTLGIGLKLNVVAMDFAYIVPSGMRESPLANTVRFSLIFGLNSGAR